MKKRLLSILLALSMVLTFLPLNAVTAFAEEVPKDGGCGANGNNLTYALTQNNADDSNPTYTLTISGTGAMEDYNYWYDVPWKDFCSKINQIQIENNVTTIGKNAFASFKNLKSITIPGSVESIGDSAFTGSGLTSITIPGNVKNLGTNIFYHSDDLGTVIIENGVPYIGEGMFKWCGKLKSITIPGSVESIGDSAFWGSGLTSITIPKSVESVAENALTGCGNLETVIIQDGAKKIWKNVFADHANLKNVRIPESVKTIEENAFSGCTGLENIMIPGVTAIKEGAFSGTGIKNITIPEGVTAIPENAFKNCSKLESITLPKSLKSGGFGAAPFEGCTSLQKIIFNGTKSDWDDSSNVHGKEQIQDFIDKVQFAHTVTFKNGTNSLGTQTVNYDAKIESAPTVTAPTGKYLTGWYKDAACTEKFDLQKNTITEDMTLYAGFDYPTLTVTNGTFTCTVDGKEITESPAKIPVGTEVTVTFDKDFFADSHLKFSYWDIDGLEDPNAYYNKESFTFTMPGNAVTLEAMPQDDSIDDAVAEMLGTTAMVTTAVAGTAVLAYTGYQLGTEFYLICLLPVGTPIPSNAAQLAELVWTDAGKPAPDAVLPEDASEDQQAMAWAVEEKLISADKAPDASVSRIEVIKTWKKAQSVKAE